MMARLAGLRMQVNGILRLESGKRSRHVSGVGSWDQASPMKRIRQEGVRLSLTLRE